MKQSRLLPSIFFIFLFVGVVTALESTELPDWQDKYMNDYGNVLSLQQRAELRTLFASIDQETTAEVTFLSVEACSPYAPGDLAVKVSNEWGIGKEDKDNGLLILYCLEENKIFAATGYGLEGILPDSKLGRLLDEQYVPQRDAGNASQGIVDFSYAVSQVISDNAEEVRSGNAGGATSYVVYFVLAMIVFIGIIFFVSFAKSAKKNKKGKYGWIRVFVGVVFFVIGGLILPLVVGWILIVIGFILLNFGNKGNGFHYMGGGGFGGGGGGFGGGGGGFGGGGFGGGGAGR